MVTPPLAPDVLAEIYAHAAEGYPEEVCGFVVAGTAARRCKNRQNELHQLDPTTFTRDARTAYNIGPEDLLFLDKSLRSDRPVTAIYHSHVDVGAYFSDEDVKAATFDGEPLYLVDYLVVDAGPGGARGAALFRWDGSRFCEVERYEGPAR